MLTLLHIIQAVEGKGKERKGEKLFIFPSDLIRETKKLPRVMTVTRSLDSL